MINTIIIDKNEQSRNLLKENLKAISNIVLCEELDEFKIEYDYKNIDLIIFDINSSTFDSTIEKINLCRKNNKDLHFIATSYEINSELIKKVTSNGIEDFILKPILINILETAIKKINVNSQDLCKTFCIFSNKGGVGKTTIATNLAWELFKKTDKKVCILDLSFNSENVAEFLNIKTKTNIENILSNIEVSNEKTILNLMDKYKDTEIYTTATKEELINKITPQKINKIINSLKNIFDFIIIDTNCLITENTLAIFNNSDLILQITTTNTTSIKNTLKSYELYDKIGYSNDKIKLVINRYIKNQKESIDEIEKLLNKKVFNTIPNNYLTLIDALNQGSNVGETNPQSNIAKAYSTIVDDLLKINFNNLNNKKEYNHGIFNLLQKRGEE